MERIRELNLVITGVGGQGQLFLSRVISETFLRLGIPSLVAETHGMSQRGGSVIVHVRIGDAVKAPTIPQKQAEIMIGMELIEAARYVDYLRDGGVAIVNEKLITPPGRNVKLKEDDLLKYLREKPIKLLTVRSSQRAVSLGIPLSANVHMFGAFIGLLEAVRTLDSSVDDVVKSVLPRRFLDQNLLLYRAGKEDIKKELNLEEIEKIKKILTEKY
ncbi:MAG: indolepyruvate oxidoreductase subunit beta [Sulfolobales archaeon]|nr:indolepyruvate oxidoreductase subunit beta [Sulfolobales archaeon]MDW8082517.1 indolepyruvate oxidoreductase subunit beta [Sulfolobales archaeon]